MLIRLFPEVSKKYYISTIETQLIRMSKLLRKKTMDILHFNLFISANPGIFMNEGDITSWKPCIHKLNDLSWILIDL